MKALILITKFETRSVEGESASIGRLWALKPAFPNVFSIFWDSKSQPPPPVSQFPAPFQTTLRGSSSRWVSLHWLLNLADEKPLRLRTSEHVFSCITSTGFGFSSICTKDRLLAASRRWKKRQIALRKTCESRHYQVPKEPPHIQIYIFI